MDKGQRNLKILAQINSNLRYAKRVLRICVDERDRRELEGIVRKTQNLRNEILFGLYPCVVR